MANVSVNKITLSKSGQSDAYVLDASQDIVSISRSGTTFTATRKDGTTFTFTQQDTNTDTKNTTGSGGLSNTKLYLVGAQTQNSSGVQTYTNPNIYIGTDGLLWVNNSAVLTAHQDISGKVDKTDLDYLNISPSLPISIPDEEETITVEMEGITADFELIRWNFSSSSENNPPVDLQWETGAGYFTVENLAGTTSETMRPVFAKVVKKTATVSNNS